VTDGDSYRIWQVFFFGVLVGFYCHIGLVLVGTRCGMRDVVGEGVFWSTGRMELLFTYGLWKCVDLRIGFLSLFVCLHTLTYIGML